MKNTEKADRTASRTSYTVFLPVRTSRITGESYTPGPPSQGNRLHPAGYAPGRHEQLLGKGGFIVDSHGCVLFF
jgi:hypothetical protein